MLKIEINTGGSAFRNEEGEIDPHGIEIRRILRLVALSFEGGAQNLDVPLFDINGNKVGSLKYEV
jgi:hypothetical protein